LRNTRTSGEAETGKNVVFGGGGGGGGGNPCEKPGLEKGFEKIVNAQEHGGKGKGRVGKFE